MTAIGVTSQPRGRGLPPAALAPQGLARSSGLAVERVRVTTRLPVLLEVGTQRLGLPGRQHRLRNSGHLLLLPFLCHADTRVSGMLESEPRSTRLRHAKGCFVSARRRGEAAPAQTPWQLPRSGIRTPARELIPDAQRCARGVLVISVSGILASAQSDDQFARPTSCQGSPAQAIQILTKEVLSSNSGGSGNSVIGLSA